MKVNVLIAVCMGVLTYALTLYFDRSAPPENAQIITAPVSTAEIQNGDEAPDFLFTTREGETHRLHDFKNKIVILNFWASWCAPCVKEFPHFLEIANMHKDDVVFVAISSDHDMNMMRRFLDKLKQDQGHDFSSNVLIGVDEHNKITRDIYKTFKLPETYIIDREQKLRSKLVGANWTIEELNALLMTL